MEQIEIWSSWEPVERFSNMYEIEDMITTETTIEIILSSFPENSPKMIRIFFDKGYTAYRFSDETYRIDTLHFVSETYKDSLKNWSFFRVSNSQYIKSLNENNYEINKNIFMHFTIFTSNFVLEILSQHEPKVELINSNWYKFKRFIS